MPIYDYKCPKCENVKEVMQKISDSPPEYCSVCNYEGDGFVKVMNAARQTHILKGSGWTPHNNTALTKRRRGN